MGILVVLAPVAPALFGVMAATALVYLSLRGIARRRATVVDLFAEEREDPGRA